MSSSRSTSWSNRSNTILVSLKKLLQILSVPTCLDQPSRGSDACPFWVHHHPGHENNGGCDFSTKCSGQHEQIERWMDGVEEFDLGPVDGFEGYEVALVETDFVTWGQPMSPPFPEEQRSSISSSQLTSSVTTESSSSTRSLEEQRGRRRTRPVSAHALTVRNDRSDAPPTRHHTWVRSLAEAYRRHFPNPAHEPQVPYGYWRFSVSQRSMESDNDRWHRSSGRDSTSNLSESLCRSSSLDISLGFDE